MQVLTVHGAKGLEWDVVAVPGLKDRQVPQGSGVPTASIATARGSPARACRGTCAWTRRGCPCGTGVPRPTTELAASIDEFKAAAGRSRSTRSAACSTWRSRARGATSAERIVVRAGVTIQTCLAVPRELLSAASRTAATGTPAGTRHAPNAPGYPPMPWPRPATPAQRVRRRLADAVCRRARAAGSQTRPRRGRLGRAPCRLGPKSRRCLRSGRSARRDEVTLPAHLSTSALVAIGGIARRSSTSAPAHAARANVRRAPRFHAPRVDRGPLRQGAAIEADDMGQTRRATPISRTLKATLGASEWADRTPTDVEVDVECPSAARVIRSRIDAVFPPGRGSRAGDGRGLEVRRARRAIRRRRRRARSSSRCIGWRGRAWKGLASRGRGCRVLLRGDGRHRAAGEAPDARRT